MMHKDENQNSGRLNMMNDDREKQNQSIIDNIRRSLVNADSRVVQDDSMKVSNIAGLAGSDKSAQENNSVIESIRCSLSQLSQECHYPETCKKNEGCILDPKCIDPLKQNHCKYDSSIDVSCVSKIDHGAFSKRNCVENECVKTQISAEISAARRAIQREVILEFLTKHREMINSMIRDEARVMMQREQAAAHKMIFDEVHKIINEYALKEVKDRVKELIDHIKNDTQY